MVKKKLRDQRATMSPYLHKTAGTHKTAASQDGAESDTAHNTAAYTDGSPLDSVSSANSPAFESPTHSPSQPERYNADDNTPVTAQILSDQLSKLQSTLQATITQAVSTAVATAIKEIQRELNDIGERTDKLETLTDDIAQRFINIEEENAFLKEELTQLRNLCEDQENRSRRQNLQIRGVPEEINNTEIQTYLKNVFSAICPDIQPDQWRFDRAHRSLALKPLPTKPPRDIIVCFHYFEVKEAIMAKIRNMTSIDFDRHKLQIFADLSPVTLAKRKELRPITQKLRNHKIPYRWGYPFKLIVNRQGQTYILQHPQNGNRFLKALGLNLQPDNLGLSSQGNRHSPPPSPQWSKVRGTSQTPRLALSPTPPRDT
uniref:L1 transposable element RRM domain-containing protein n=1 Tax=Xenopus tropicalis TaxID=8364 RepID=A0A803JEW2_XENTR